MSRYISIPIEQADDDHDDRLERAPRQRPRPAPTPPEHRLDVRCCCSSSLTITERGGRLVGTVTHDDACPTADWLRQARLAAPVRPLAATSAVRRPETQA
jgi:hypothetical protein